MNSNNGTNVISIVLLVCLLTAVAALVGYTVLDRPVAKSGEAELFTVSRGSSVLAITAALEKQSLVRSSFFASVLTRLRNYSLKAGTYRISPRLRTTAILELIHEGKQETLRITVPEGLTITKTARLLEDAGVVSRHEFEQSSRNPELLARFGIPAGSAEGFLFPDTYTFHYGVDADDIVATMLSTFFRKTAELENLPESREKLFEKVILASIVEREYRVAREAPLIASVFSNRLKIGMGLQSCSTVEYIITEIQGKPHPERLLAEDLEIPSDYNTYLWAGLPPGPIANPGLTALTAVLDPPGSPYLYFRLTDPVQGTHVFTRSLDEHVDAGRKLYLKKAAGN